jgi:hypothetical protein
MNDGYCLCGCGEKTPISKYTAKHRGAVKGQPTRYRHGHAMKGRTITRLADAAPYEITDTGCWIWRRTKAWSGYAMMRDAGKGRLAHRVYFERAKGPIPAGYQLDHLCRERLCVNPDHLEVVTRRENVRRGANTKLTAEMVKTIRREFREDGGSRASFAKRIAPRYAVSWYCVEDVLKGRTWKDGSVPT